MADHNLSGAELDNIVSKIQKVLALTTSPNQGEAEAAALQAQKLLQRYNLTMAMVESHEGKDKSPYAKYRIELGQGKMIEWQRDLIFTLARYNFCRAVMFHGTRYMAIVGQDHNYQAVMGLYDYLNKALTRLVETALTSAKLEGYRGHSLTFKTSWLDGAVDGVRAQLREQQAAFASESQQTSALVVVKDAELDQAMSDLIGKTGIHKSAATKDASAYASGYVTGKGISLNKQVNGSTSKALAG